jgi:Ca-activated chloride channel homolog
MKTKLMQLFAAGLMALPLVVGAKSARDVSVRAELDRGVLPADQKVTAVVKVTLDAPPPPEKKDRPPVNLCLVLDRSGSMSGQKIEKAKEAAIEAVKRLGPKDIVSLVTFDHEVETLVSAQSAAHTEEIVSRIQSITSRGNTAIYGGVSQGAAEVRKNAGGKYVSRIVLMSDGMANVGPAKPDDLGRLGVSLLKEGISVTTVGLGTDYNEDLMTKLAQNSDGNTYFVENSSDLVRVFNVELGEVLSVVAREVKIKIEFTGGVKPLRIIGREGIVRDGSAEVYLNQLYGGQEKYALIEVEVPPTAHEKTRDLCKASVSYENLLTEKTDAQTCTAQARFNKEEAVVQKSANLEVQYQTFKNVMADVQGDVISLADKGQVTVANIVFATNVANFQGWAITNNYAPALKDIELYNKQQQEIVVNGSIPNESRKSMRTDSLQTRSQQYKK